MTTGRHVIVIRDAPTLAEAAAQRVVDAIKSSERAAAICLTGGSTPKRLYELLATSSWRGRIPWPRVHWFIGDDRFVPFNDPLSNFGMAQRAFLDSCAPAQNVHPIRTDAASPDEAARLYEAELRTFAASRGHPPLFDLTLLGVGPDGHVASLFPGYPAAREVKPWAVGVPQAHVAPFVPRVSLTLPCLGDTKEMLFLAAGHDKKEILSRVFSGEDLPASHAHANKGETVWLIDEAAAPPDIPRSFS
ncbi:MAG: 6-phosphogluconolactonase [Bradyrhizobiaceae bacterium]|nr:MAG: 6-phosphogluconolactonase [Bradyrhizobiaceae bacterium]